MEHSHEHTHQLQLYKADRALIGNAGRYFYEGLVKGESVLVIAARPHQDAFQQELRALGADVTTSIREQQLSFLDSEATLDRVLHGGWPEWAPFEAAISDALLSIPSRRGQNARVYGDMVGVLWKRGEVDAAIRLEELWNTFLRARKIKLFCAYPIDIFSKEFDTPAMRAVIDQHTNLVPYSANGDVQYALERAIHEWAGSGGVHMPKALAAGEGIRQPEAFILSLRKDFPETADQVLERAQSYFQSEQRFRALIDHSSDAISLLDENARVLYASASNSRVLGVEAPKLIGRKALALNHSEDRKRARQALREALANPRIPVQFELRVRRRGEGCRWLEGACTNMLHEPDIQALVCNYRDITERKAAEEKRARDAAELARFNADLQAFTYAVTHDLKEPLRTVCAFTQLLTQNSPLDENGKAYAGFIVDGVKRMAALLDDLLLFTSLQGADGRSRVDLRTALDQAIGNLGQAIGESGAEISIGSLPEAYGNESHLVQVFQNLLSNAIKYRGAEPPEIHITSERNGLDWLVKVSDNGMGIAPQYHDVIFGLFKRLHSQNVPGTGMGLAVAKKMIENGGGRMWVESDSGRGATFCFTVPVLKEALHEGKSNQS